MSDSDAVTGIAWYRRDQMDRFRELVSDADKIEASYEDWLLVPRRRAGPDGLRRVRTITLTSHFGG